MTRRDYELLARSLRQKREAMNQQWLKGASLSMAARLMDRERDIQMMEDHLVEVLSGADATFKEDRFRLASKPRTSK